MKNIILLISLLFYFVLPAQTINYSPAYFGPSASPVAEISGALIPEFTSVEISGNYFFGYGDRAVNPELKIEIPLLPQRVSLKLWVAIWEKYWVTPVVYAERQMQGDLSGITNGGDIYVQTRISILEEKKYLPAAVLNSTLKSASGEAFPARRYFNTPGYYFDLESAKSFSLKSRAISNVRIAADLGFLCYETAGANQNDAWMYGCKIMLSNRVIDFDHTLAGYRGRFHNGDNPLVYSAKLTGKFNTFSIFTQYQYGIRDWNFHRLQAGIAFSLSKLTPNYK